MKRRIGILTSGGDCPGLNAAIRGVARAAYELFDAEIIGIRNGYGGLIEGEYQEMSKKQFSGILTLGGTILGTKRTPFKMMRVVEDDNIDKVAAMKKTYKAAKLDCLLCLGGNGTHKTANLLSEEGLNIIGLPKTIDNDIAVTDHAPGYGSAARYIAGTVSEISQDVRSLPIHVCIVETMGRNCGWITAASALARTGCGDGPDLIYLPERPFDPRRFLEDVERLHREKGGVLVAASEGLRDLGGNPIVEPVVRIGRAAYYGDVGSHLSNLVIRELGIKARSEKPGIGDRASIAFQSPLDCAEAEEAGRRAVRAAWDGQTGVMVGLRRISDSPYRTEDILVPIEQVMLRERTMPDEFISPEGNDVTPAFLQWCRPLLGGPLRRFVSFRQLL